MPKITIAKTAGFCFGVDRAVKIVYDELEKHKVATYGPIIHNPNVVEDLTKKGVRIVNFLDELHSDEFVIIRSHGVPESVYDEINRLSLNYIDATCPFVERIHKIVKEKSDSGYTILIAGDKIHPEVEGIVGHCSEKAFIFADDFEIENFFKKNNELFKKKVAIVAQTTYNIRIWDKCVKIARQYCKEAEIYNTICDATTKRQAEAIGLAKQSDAMVIIGGKHSSNTVKLFTVCSELCKCYLIENADELRGIDFSNTDSIGITA
ncbi:MAG: 4-hydroxy-3-methylbut-2-enyl diphosphate reductase, partial [Oscillospiraceae bacterium]